MGRRSDDRSSAARRDPRLAAPLQIPKQVHERVRALCLALPEVTVRVDEPQVSARSTAWSYDIRRRSFCLLVAVRGRNGKPATRLVLRVDPRDREALVSFGHPYFYPHAGHRHRDRVGMWLTDDTDWEEVRELVTESYRLLAPKKLTPLLDRTAKPVESQSPSLPLPRTSRSPPHTHPRDRNGRQALLRQPRTSFCFPQWNDRVRHARTCGDHAAHAELPALRALSDRCGESSGGGERQDPGSVGSPSVAACSCR
jgi:predicted DNA-binding protein (MmcQ/YjbR family)